MSEHEHERDKSVAWRPDGPYAVHVWTCKGCDAVGLKKKSGPEEKQPTHWYVREDGYWALNSKLNRVIDERADWREKAVAAAETITTLETEREELRQSALGWKQLAQDKIGDLVQAETELAALKEYVRDDAWGHEEAGLCWCDDGDHVETNEQCSRIYEIVMGRKRIPNTQPGSREVTKEHGGK